MDGQSDVLDKTIRDTTATGIIKIFRRNGRTWAVRVCRCGKKRMQRLDSIRRGDAQTCGCLVIETARKMGLAARQHGMYLTRTYNTWSTMKQRCTNPKNPNFRRYGARRITLCARWMKFENFLIDMGKRPRGKSLDRRDNEKGYSLSNCRWATRSQQRKNHSANCPCCHAKGSRLKLAATQKSLEE